MQTHSTFQYCVGCGTGLVAGMRFCDHCGTGLSRGNVRNVTFGPVVIQAQLVPRRINGLLEDYVLLDELGRGGMGRVLRAMACQSGQQFAIKVISDDFTLRSAPRRLKEEAERQSQIVHPNVVRVYRFVDFNRTLGIVMELVNGITLDELRKQTGGPVSLDYVLWLMPQMAAGLAEIHRNGYVHADVKPSNYMVSRENGQDVAVKLTDFGIARDLKAELTGRGKRLRAGTPGFMSPEQIEGKPLDVASDFYSLGCVMYELLAGQPVFANNDIDELYDAHMRQPPTSLRHLAPSTPEWVERLILWMLAKDKRRRPASANDILEHCHQAAQVEVR